jgi:aminopeptidase N
MRLRRWLGAVLLCAGCTESGVRTEGAASVSTTSPVTASTVPEAVETAPPSTEPVTVPPRDAAPPPSASSVPAGDPEDPSTSSGDELFPELGSADLDVASYDVRLTYDVATTTIDGAVTIEATVRRPLEVLALDAAGMTVEAVTVDGAPATFEHTAPELLIRPARTVEPGEPVVVDVEYTDDRHQTDPGFGFGGGWFPVAGGSYVLNEPDGARQWLPSNDHPADKATWRFEITVAEGLAAVANGHLVEERPGPRGTTWVWEQREPMATYLVQLLIGDYEVLDGGVAGDTPLTNAALREDVGRMQPYFDLTDDQLAFFEPLFGPYPLEQYGLAFAESVPGLAMETQGRSLFSRADFSGTLDQTAHLLMSHELAHQWFGDAVTPADWSDLWLNESFATYGQWLWLDHVGIADLELQAEFVLAARQEPTEPTGEPTIGNLFGFERYDGGAAVVHALRRELGDETFFALLQRWVAENDGTSRTTEDFTSLASDVAGRDLTEFFEVWLYAPSLPPSFPE